MDITKIIEIARDTKQVDLLEKLEEIKAVLNQPNAPLVMPLIGEFSSGKTTLINALTDCKQLETATKPTTATIYEIFFGNPECSARVINEDGSTYEVSDISELKNETLKDALAVNIFDTSTKVPPTTVLVDTPGLSSPTPKHKEVLLSFLPKADGVLLVTDVNQQLTKSLVDFCKSVSLSKRPIYLIITKCDSKSKDEVEKAKKYIQKSQNLNIKDIACVSAKNDDLQELYDMLAKIDADKNSILKAANEHRLKNITKTLSERIDELLNAANNTDELDNAIKEQNQELARIKRNIDTLIDDASSEIGKIEYETCKTFQDSIFEKLESIITANIENYDDEALAYINGTTSQSFNNYTLAIQKTLYNMANERRNTEQDVSLQSLVDIDYSQFELSDVTYNLNLNELGHKYDGWISGGVKVLGAAAMVAGTIATAGVLGGVAAGAGTIATVGTAAKAGLANSIDAIAVGGLNFLQNRKQQKRLTQLTTKMAMLPILKNQLTNNMEDVERYNTVIAEKLGQKKGFVEGIVGKITNNIGKPQRQRVIHNYIDNSLMPEFTSQLKRISQELTMTIRKSLNDEAEYIINQKTCNLNELKEQRANEQAEYENRIQMLADYKKQLII